MNLQLKVVRQQPKPVLNRNRACAKCALHTGVQSVCIPTTLYSRAVGWTDTAVLVLGEAPGANEDEQDSPFVGRSGAVLKDWLEGARIPQYADVYMGNVVRCRPQQNQTPSVGHIRACLSYTHSDLLHLSQRYKRVAVLLAGAIPVKAVLGLTQQESFKQQGKCLGSITWDTGIPGFNGFQTLLNVFTFSVYHPARILRDPRLEKVVENHMVDLWEWLESGAIKQEKQPGYSIGDTHTTVESKLHQRSASPIVSFDIETYGCLINAPTQTVFHPVKSHRVDGVHPRDQIVCASACVTTGHSDDNPESSVVSVVYNLDSKIERDAFRDVLFKASRFVGQNIQFDIGYLRECYPDLRWALEPYRKIASDLIVDSFIYDDLSPERGLKSLAPRYRIASFTDDPKPVKAYRSRFSRKLYRYCAKDSWATLRVWQKVRNQSRREYSAIHNAEHKFSPRCDKWFSDQIWTAVLQEEHGLAVNRRKLRVLHKRCKRIMARIQREIPEFPMGGKGSKTAVAAVIRELSGYLTARPKLLGEYGVTALQELLARERTTKKNELKTTALVRNTLIGLVPTGHVRTAPLVLRLQRYGEYASYKKLVTSYTASLLWGKKRNKGKKGTLQVGPGGKLVRVGGEFIDRSGVAYPAENAPHIGIAHPRVYIVPRESDTYGRAGGVRQYRHSVKDPAVHTFPPIVTETLTTRFSPGVLAGWDLKQIEWRMGGFFSQDPVMLDEIRRDFDPHTRSAEFLLPDLMVETPDFIRSEAGRTALCACPDALMRETARKFYAAPQGRGEFIKTVRKWGRQNAGKSQNFAWLYDGKGGTIQATTRSKTGMDVAREHCDEFVDMLDGMYSFYARSKKLLLVEAAEYGAIHLPILGVSRTFGKDVEAIRKLYHAEIADLPIQALSAFVLQWTAADVCKRLFQQRSHMSSKMVLNWHDALYCDMPKREVEAVKQLVDHSFKTNRFLRELEEYVGKKFGRRTTPKFPLAWEYKVVAERSAGE